MQSVSKLLPASELAWFAQASQVSGAGAATVSDHVLTPQSTHAIEPVASLYLPTTHPTHAAPSGPVYPSTQEQLVMVLLPWDELVWSGQDRHVSGVTAATVVEYMPPPQSRHTPVPCPTLYVPASQPVHFSPSGPV